MGQRSISARIGLIAASCALLTGCAGFGAGLGLGMQSAKRKWIDEACLDLARRNVGASEVADIQVPADEGKVDTFEPAQWQVEGALLGQEWPLTRTLLGEFNGKNPTAPVAGALVVTERSVVFVPAHGVRGVRIPFVAVIETPYRYNLMGEPHAVVVESCGGRLDVFTLGQRSDPQAPDPEATRRAGSAIDARFAETADRASLMPWERGPAVKP